MRSNLKLTILVFSGVAAAAVASDSKAQNVTINSPVGTFTSSTTTPWTTYTYSSPHLSVYSGVQFGNNQNTTVVQNSTRNISGFAQVGNNLNATVAQAGAHNFSALSQTGHNSSALVFQFGH